ncbi:hypothetical protein HPP92_020589 [Vanilla planifolia]|uniref:Uncharacterized protein n=1 Tax=Vanilla planifolia TaxID=51239 RepID=A0A835UI05_VANPL|nr:hypothetical protein HPP92_020589 [Vanilla planifolia]
MWSNGHGCPPGEDNEEDSWEVRAFAADTGNASGTTWPLGSTLCLLPPRVPIGPGARGHMNVHRRDRARLQQRGPEPSRGPPQTGFPTEHGGNGPCFYYAQQGQNAAGGQTVDSANFYFSVADEQNPNPNHHFGTINFGAVRSTHEDYSTLEKMGSSRTDSDDGGDDGDEEDKGEEESVAQELDLELRLGW